MKINLKRVSMILLVVIALLALAIPVFAETADNGAQPAAAATQNTDDEAAEADDGGLGSKALASGIAVGLAAAGGALAMGLATGKAVEGISRQPEADGKIRTSLMLGLVFIETAIIYALLVVILIIFVL
ncbi:MAG: ATP synthase F0 subunit C [Acutalibacteraceae bacterium]